jgi:hypothetical protein
MSKIIDKHFLYIIGQVNVIKAESKLCLIGGVPQYAELPPLAEDPDEPDGSLPVKKLSKLTFSSQPIKASC